MRSHARPGSIAALLVVLTTVSACGGRGQLAFDPQAASVGTVQTVLVSTNRAPQEGSLPYSGERSEVQHYARYDVSVPPTREEGSISFPDPAKPNPETDFIVVDQTPLTDTQAFSGEIDRVLAGEAHSDRDSLVFIHGYNVNFAEGLFRHTQLHHDLGRRGAAIHFSWPSQAKLRGYVYDRESALYSREALMETLDAVADADTPRFNIAAHSMGTFLLMDTLWMMALSGHDDVFGKIGSVLLVSPDIEVDVFRKQAPPVLARGVPIYVIVSSKDRALRLSSVIRDGQSRLGAIQGEEELGDLDVVVIDISSISTGDMAGHFKPATSPAVIEFVKDIHESGDSLFDTGNQSGLITSSVAVTDNLASDLPHPGQP